MSARGTRTTIRFGGVRAEVALLKTSGPPKAAKYDTKRVAVEPTLAPMVAGEPIAAGEQVAAGPDGRVSALGRVTDELHAAAAEVFERNAEVFGEPDPDAARDIARTFAKVAERSPATLPAGPEDDPLDDETPVIPATVPPAETTTGPVIDAPAPAPTKVLQGVVMDDGSFVDLTERFTEVDERTKLDGMEVVATIARSAIPSDRVRDSHYVAAIDPKDKVLALLWRALRETRRAAAVRWTKKTAQAAGLIVARGSLGEDAHLVLLEVEWAANVRKPERRVLAPINAPVDEAEVAAAVELVEAFEAGPSAMDGLRDERLGKRADLIALAREGRLAEYVPPAQPKVDVVVDDLTAAFEAAAAALR